MLVHDKDPATNGSVPRPRQRYIAVQSTVSPSPNTIRSAAQLLPKHMQPEIEGVSVVELGSARQIHPAPIALPVPRGHLRPPVCQHTIGSVSPFVGCVRRYGFANLHDHGNTHDLQPQIHPRVHHEYRSS